MTAALAAAAVFVAACTTGEGNANPTTASAPVPDPAHALMLDAVGGEQAVQDFIVHLDMSVLADDELTPILDQVTERAGEDAGDPVDLAGGFVMRPVVSLEAEIVDSQRRPLPSMSVDFALLDSAPGQSTQLRDLLTEVLGGGDDVIALIDGIIEAEDQDSGTLVEIVSASYRDRLSHAGPGDSSVLDLSFVSSPEGTTLFSMHLFGQTLPGDPDLERGLSPHELFAYRWNAGLVRLLGSQDGVQVVAAAATLETGERTSASGGGLPLAMVVGPFLRAQGDESTGPVRRQDVKAFAEFQLSFGAYFAAGQMAERMVSEVREATKKSTSSLTVVFVNGAMPLPGTRGGVRAVPDHCIAVSRTDGGPPTLEVGFRQTPPGEVPSEQDKCEKRVPTNEIAYSLWWRLSTWQSMCVGLRNELRRANNAADRAERRAAEEQWTSTTFVGPTTPLVGPTPPESPDPLPPPPPATPSCEPPAWPGRSGGTVGDVHLVTFDQLVYDNQAAGEFLVFDNGLATVQMRTEPWQDSDIASVATAVAVAVDGRAVSMHAAGPNRVGETWIDGEPTELERGVTVALGDGALVWTGTGWVVVWSDGTRLTVDDRGDRLMFTISPSDLPIEGMLGDGDGDPDNDLLTRDGTLIPVEVAIDPPPFYDTYIDSWRITADESLFHYGPGESTESFHVAGFPDHTVTFEDLIDDGAGEAAEAACREGGITRPELIAACVYDLVVTGDESFVYDHYVMDESLPEPPTPDSASPDPAPAVDGPNVLSVGDLSFGFEASPGWCTSDEISLGAAHSFTDTSGRQVDLSIQYVDAEDPLVSIVVQVDRQAYAWLNTTVTPASGSVAEHAFGDGALTLAGSAFVNEPVDPGLSWNQPLPGGSAFVPFELRIRCEP